MTSNRALRKILNKVTAQADEDCVSVGIGSNRGKGAVLIGENERVSIEETLHLMEIPGMEESLIAGMNEPDSECVPESELGW